MRNRFQAGILTLCSISMITCAQAILSLRATADSALNVGSPVVTDIGELTATDVFIGKGVIGPYVLTWKGIVAGSEKVMRNSTQLSSATDYRLDASNGDIFFTTPLGTSEIARVDYLYIPGQAAANPVSNPVSNPSPVKLNLLTKLQGSLVLDAIMQPPDLSSGMSSLVLNPMEFILGANTRFSKQSNLQSSLYMDSRGGDLLQRSGLKIDQQNNASFGTIGFHFSRGGVDFAPTTATDIASGSQVFDGSANFKPIMGIRAAASITQTSQLTASGTGDKQTVMNENFSGAYRSGTQFSLTNTQTYLNPADSAQLSTMENNLNISRRAGKASNIEFALDCLSRRQNGTTTRTSNSSLSFSSQPSKIIKWSGSWVNSFNGQVGLNDTNLNLEADPRKQLKIIATMEDKIQGANTLHNREAQLNFTPLQSLTLTGDVQGQTISGAKDLCEDMGATVKPVRYIVLNGGVKVRDSNWGFVSSADKPDSYHIQLALQLPRNRLKLTSGMETNPYTSASSFTLQSSQNLGIQSTLGSIDLTGNYAISRDVLDTGWVRHMELQLGWRLTPNNSLNTAYTCNQTMSLGLTTINDYSLHFTHSLGSVFNMSLGGEMTDTLQTGGVSLTREYQANAQLALQF